MSWEDWPIITIACKRILFTIACLLPAGHSLIIFLVMHSLLILLEIFMSCIHIFSSPRQLLIWSRDTLAIATLELTSNRRVSLVREVHFLHYLIYKFICHWNYFSFFVTRSLKTSLEFSLWCWICAFSLAFHDTRKFWC